MLQPGNAIFLLIPSASNKRLLHPASVIESDATSIVAKFEEAIAPAAGSDLNVFYEVRGRFLQQGVNVTEIRAEGECPVIAFKCSGDAVSAESRQTFRVSIAVANVMARIDKERNCHLVDVSPEGFAIVATKQYPLGSLMQCSFTYEGTAVAAIARVQTMQARKDGKFRYGLLVPKSNAAARKSLQQISSAAQRMQLRRLRGAA